MSRNDSVYKHNEWGETRKKVYDFYHNPSKENYLKMILEDATKISAAVTLYNNFNFSNCNLIGDLGGVPFSQSWTLSQLKPDLTFLLTDFDGSSIETHALVPPVDAAKLATLDLKGVDYSILNECDLLMMWAVDYALEDDDLLRLFAYLKLRNVPLLLAAIRVFDPPMKRLLKIIRNKVVHVRGHSRMHAVLRNERYLRKLAELSNVDIETVTITENYHILRVN